MGKASRTKEQRRTDPTLPSHLRKDPEEILADLVVPSIEGKELLVTSAPAGVNDDLPPVMSFYRGGVAVARGICREVCRDDALECVLNATVLFAADAVGLVVDSHATSVRVNPTTGKPWGATRESEMQDLCNELGYCETGLITDTIYIARFERAGHTYWCSLPYHVHHSTEEAAGEVIWVKHSEVGGYGVAEPGHRSKRLEGLIPDTLRDAFAAPICLSTEHVAKVASESNITLEESRHYADMAAVMELMTHGRGRWDVGLATAGS
jgi:hypothetical protein